MKKRETRERILHAAAVIARREGLPAASIPRVMAAAGLTVGGFYGHFPSKAAMDAEVIRVVFGAIPGRSLAHLEGHHGFDWVRRALEGYLTPLNRDHPDGCAYPSILSHVATGPPEVKSAFADALELRIRAYQAHMPPVPGVSGRERAVAAMALTIGALLLARASAGSAVSDEVLAACQKWALPELTLPPERRRRAQ
jgi:TetR/AcrR family transcriptional repressor of nem operon